MKPLLAALLLVVLASPPLSAVLQAQSDTTIVSLRGTLEKFDPGTQTLLVKTRQGSIALQLGPHTRIRQGHHTIEIAALETLHGYRAVVRYAEAEGGRVVQSIHVLDKS